MANPKRKEPNPVAALWATLAFLGCAVIFVLAMHMANPPLSHVALSSATRAPGETAAQLYNPARPAQRILFGRTAYRPLGAPISVPSQELALLGETHEGYLLYARTRPGGGGGQRPLYVQPEHLLYLETLDGHYQRVVKR